MHPRPWNRAERRSACRDFWADVYEGGGWRRATWAITRTARQRAHRQRLQWQRFRRARGIRARIAYHDGDYHGRNVWRG